MPDDDTAAVAALADDARRALYEFVVAQRAPVGREQAAAALDMPLHRVRFHLERLERAGLLEADYARAPGRSGPGAGRPAKRYRRADREVAVSLPPREYDLAGSLLASAIDAATATGEPVAAAVARVARERGRALATRGGVPAGDALDAAAAALAELGFEPHREGDVVELANCPFHELSRAHTALVCGMNASLIGGLVEALAPGAVHARLDPAPGRCCVVLEIGPSAG
ncbi:helix-turn-helix transcriptional regulator [Agrococcus sp. TSP3-2-1]|uniref:helix-turn-helix transcriptional regulator n=1 Tax=Agrococcus sp. TSP3-2-1 TaxID=2804583 RepID=UPI003CF62794